MMVFFLVINVSARPPFDNTNNILDGIWNVKIVLSCKDFVENNFEVKLFKPKTLMDLQFQEGSTSINPGDAGYIPSYAITTFFISKRREPAKKVGDGKMYFDFPFNYGTECDGKNVCYDGDTRIIDGWVKFEHTPNSLNKFTGTCMIDFSGIIKEIRKKSSKIKANTIGFCWEKGTTNRNEENISPNALAGSCAGNIKAEWRRIR
jgi:hypothetical protein